MKSALLIASLLLSSAFCQIVITGTTGGATTSAATTGTVAVTAATTGTTGIPGTTAATTTGTTGTTAATTTGTNTGIITGVGTTGSAVGNAGTVDIPAGNYALFGPISGPASLNVTISVSNGAPVDIGVVSVDHYAAWRNGSASTLNFDSTEDNQTNAAFPLTVDGAALYLFIANNASSLTAANQASSINYAILGAVNTIGAVVVPYTSIPTTTTGTTTGTGGSASSIVSIPSDQYYYWAVPGPINGAAASFGVTSGAPIDVFFLVDNAFTQFQNRQTFSSLFRNLSVNTASFQNINIAQGSTLYMVIGNALSDLTAVASGSTVQYQFNGFPTTANLVPIPMARNSTVVAATTGTSTSTSTTTGTTGTTGGVVPLTVLIPSTQLAQFTAVGPANGGSATFTSTNGVPFDILMLTNNNLNLFLNGQPYETAYQVLGTTSNVASPINLSAGNTLYMLVGNNLLNGANAAQANVQYSFSNLNNPQLSTITRPGVGIITTSTPQPNSSSSTVVVTWLMAFLCVMAGMAF